MGSAAKPLRSRKTSEVLEDGVAQGGAGGLGLAEVGGEIVAEAQEGVDTGDDAFLFGERGQREWFNLNM